MGIKGLGKFIRDNTTMGPAKDLKDYRGATFYIDTSLILYEFVLAMQLAGNPDPDQLLQQYGILQKTFQFLEAGIRPVYVFDGPASHMKAAVIATRKEAEEKRKAKGEAEHLFKPTHDLIDRIKFVLTELGVDWIQAPDEADITIAAATIRGGPSSYAYSRDLDMLTFGAPRVVVRDGKKYNTYTLNDSGGISINKFEDGEIIEKIITRPEFITLCILFGCDYMSGIRGIGPKTAEKLILNAPPGTSPAAIIAGQKNATPDVISLFTRVHEYFTTAAARVPPAVIHIKDEPAYHITHSLNEFLVSARVRANTIAKWQKTVESFHRVHKK
jgi:flap endonuclease-1